jgi:hypothetical protein
MRSCSMISMLRAWAALGIQPQMQPRHLVDLRAHG